MSFYDTLGFKKHQSVKNSNYLSMSASFPIFRFIPFGLFLTFALQLVGCSHKVVIHDQDIIIINNHGTRAIHSLLVKPCSKPYEEFEEMAKDIKPGSTTFIRLYPGCFDADALDRDGELIATQYKLRLPPQLRWDVY